MQEKHFPQPVEIIPKIDHTERPAQQRRNTVAASTVKRKDFETVAIQQVAEQYASAGVHDKRERLSKELLPDLTYDPGLKYLEAWGRSGKGRYGQTFMSAEIRKKVQHMFEKGNTCKSSKKSPWQVHEDLKKG